MSKQIHEMSFEEISKLQTLGLDDTFPFTCKACGKCCKNRRDIVLTPFDVFRIAGYLGRTPEEIISRYCKVYEGQDSHFPIVWLAPVPPDNACPFLRNKRCFVHNAKPVVCRVYPLARIYQVSGESKYYLNGSSCSHEPKPVAVREWIGDIATEESEQAGRVWTDGLMCLLPAIHPDKLGHREDREQILRAVFAYLWLPYDTKEAYTPQLKRNLWLLKEYLQEHFGIKVPQTEEFLSSLKERYEK
ncbi:YkgJ family cysteine cluster protein [Anaerocolumna xylanovorans]|uniref:YkgJ family cysteine cluster protein n=1 Tax=Anaerocolumna xylanovorans DSM 12503 TaxID=1121345 RepID=A0A1M7YND3_9FIRM|nr:YkgJ family cysteine cluster protein [Anaerocolumna xylanovorans]SHO54132.1 hypothetical protein SAMN02745217_04587 [Anaerocolumna xylanovorans DSM 12503]